MQPSVNQVYTWDAMMHFHHDLVQTSFLSRVFVSVRYLICVLQKNNHKNSEKSFYFTNMQIAMKKNLSVGF